MKISGWGRYPWAEAEVCSYESLPEAQSCLTRPGQVIPRGMGRSYGDSAVGGRVLETRRSRLYESFDPHQGTLVCQAGVTLDEIVETFLPRGWFLQVTPGTKLITVGGAIASDVHGKNHHGAGCFSSCVNWFELVLPDGTAFLCSRTENRDLFRAACGGMGLVGLITRASINLQPVKSAMIAEKALPARNLAETFQIFESNAELPYSVAWMDVLTRGPMLGRSVVFVGRHANEGPLRTVPATGPTMPLDAPSFMLNKLTVSTFNNLFYRVNARPKFRMRHLDGFFYPLDAIGDWNRMYGRNGFTQYQFVIPKETAFEGMTAIIRRISASGSGSFLTVFKLLGPANDNYLSFPLEGYTLALDFKIEPKLFGLLDELDRIVLDHGGRIYLAKDVRMDRTTFEAGYPELAKFRAIREKYGLKGKLESRQSLRLGI